MLRKFCPERQAVNLSELEKLLDADSLQKLVEELNDCEGEQEEESNTIAGSDTTNTLHWNQVNNCVLIGSNKEVYTCYHVKISNDIYKWINIF